jgi:PmbA protein
MTDLSDLAENAVKKALRLGASHCDVIVMDSRYVIAEIEKSSMKQASIITDSGIGIRAFLKGSPGYAYTTGHAPKAVDRAVRLAVSQAGAGTPDPEFKDLPRNEKPPKVSGLFEAKIAKIEPDAVVDMAIALSNAASSDKRIVAVNAGVGVGSGTVALANSNGFSRIQKLTSFEASAESVARSGSKMFSCVDGVWSRKLEESSLSSAGKNAMEHAIQGLRSKKLATGDYPVVLDSLAAGFIMLSAIGGGINAESVQKKRSYLSGRLGQIIGNDRLTIHDDPTVPWALGSYAFDGEGAPGMRKTIVDRGVLKSYLYDSYTAGKDGIKTTGNASRGGANWSYRHPPAISPSNIMVSKGKDTFEEMIEETRKGVYLRITYDYPNLTTGEFSGMMMESFVIDKGEIGPSIQQSTIGIGMVDLFSRIDMLGRKQRDAFGVRVPPMRISNARIGGSG